MLISFIPIVFHPIALTGQTSLYMAGSAIAGSLLTLSIIVGAFLALYAPEKDND